jgi:ArsR family transcriptional regulator
VTLAPDASDVADCTALLGVVADPVRWRILAGLTGEPRCVCRIQDDVDVSASLLSYHLKVLREAGLINATRRGRWIDYTLAPGAHDRVAAALPTVGR